MCVDGQTLSYNECLRFILRFEQLPFSLAFLLLQLTLDLIDKMGPCRMNTEDSEKTWLL